MARFNRDTVTTRTKHPVSGSRQPDTIGHYGQPAYSRDEKSELFTLAVSSMCRPTYYETELGQRDRLINLVSSIVVTDVDWIIRFLAWLRRDANMRTISLIAGIEAARVMREHGIPGGRGVVDSVLMRADEPAEALAYWRSQHGAAIPKPIKRGIADACARLYSQSSAAKYDTRSRGYRMGDVIRLTHPLPSSPEQSQLFRYLSTIVSRPDAAIPLALSTIRRNKVVKQKLADPDTWRNALSDLVDHIASASLTWENVLSIAGEAGIDPAKAWEAVIPSMGVMALVRNLRNFDEAGVSDAVAEQVAAKISNPGDLRRSRQLPYRFYSAYCNTGSDRWKWALSKALDIAVSNVVSLRGRTLVLCDQSPSMFPAYQASSRDGSVGWNDKAALFAATVALRAESADLYGFGGTYEKISFSRGDSVLATAGKFGQINATDINYAVAGTYAGHDRVVIFTDEQTESGWTGQQSYAGSYAARLRGDRPHYDAAGRVVHSGGCVDDVVPASVPVYVWNLAGYAPAYLPGETANRYTVAGLTDAAFNMIASLENGRDSGWVF